MIIDLLKSAGIKLKTAGKICKEDITIKPLLQSKDIAVNGIVTPDDGYVGLSSINVNVPSSGGAAIEIYDGTISVE